MNYLAEKLEPWGVLKIVGATGQETRLRFAKRFQYLPKFRVAIVSLAGGEQIDLFGEEGNRNRTILFAERQFVPSLEEQLESRLHRMGQKENVSAYYLVAKRTIDERMAGIVDRKRKVYSKIIDLSEVETSVAQELIKEFTNES